MINIVILIFITIDMLNINIGNQPVCLIAIYYEIVC